MKKNMGVIDRIGRILIAVVIIVLILDGQVSKTAGIILLALAAVFIVTSFIGTCPLYLPFGIDTNQKSKYK